MNLEKLIDQLVMMDKVAITILFAPLCIGILIIGFESFERPGDCRSIGGVMCWSHAIVVFGSMWSVPIALIIFLTSAVARRCLRKQKLKESK